MTNDQWDIIQSQNRQLLMDLFKYAPQVQFMINQRAFEVRNGEIRIKVDKNGAFRYLERLLK